MASEVGTVLKSDGKASRNAEAVRALLEEMRGQEGGIKAGGGRKAAEAQHGKGRLTARERIGLLVDEGTEVLELGLWAAYGMYGEWGGAPASGVGGGDWAGAGKALHDRGERRDGEGGGVLSDDGEEGAAGAGDCVGESDSYAVSGGFFRACFCRCRTRCFPIRMTLDGCSGITR